MRTACCLIPLLFTLAAEAQGPKRPKLTNRRFQGTVLELRLPKGPDGGLLVLRLTGADIDRDGVRHDVVKKLTFSQPLRDGKLDPRVREANRWRHPHLPKDLKTGALIEVYADLEPDSKGQYVVQGIHADLKKLQKEFMRKAGWGRTVEQKAKDKAKAKD